MPRRSRGDSKDSATKNTMNPPQQGGHVQTPQPREDPPAATERQVGQFTQAGTPAKGQR
jgi:hypothetical protein